MLNVRLHRLLAFSLIAAAPGRLAAQAPYGVHPRATPADYSASQQTASGTFAASLVPRAEVKRLFSVDISGTYVVLEVACYPAPTGSITLSADDFLVKSGPNSEFTHPADAVTVASVIQEKNAPRPPSSQGTTTVSTTAAVGYESATDPTTGRKIHGTYTEVGTAVNTGGPNAGPPMPQPAGSSDYDRMTLQDQLAQRAFPSGTFAAPVAGFLYFPAKELKKKDGVYELEYLTNGSGNIRLQVPAKTR